ncbi:MAG: hypothetical protein Q4C48_05690 [Lachnospiraceae bacterium]|nr:hypothetical protein [Lachnospiraceae bacterium]
MKKKKIRIALGVVLCAAAIFLFVNWYKENKKFYITGEIASVEVTSSLDGISGGAIGPIQTSDEEQIALLLECIKDVQKNNWYWLPDVAQEPIDYEITFTFQNGETETYQYREYPAKKYEYPFRKFYKIFFPEFYE